jgi:FkbM family methyltransferase
MTVRGLGRLGFEARRARGQLQAWQLGLHRWSPNYAVLPHLSGAACVVDVGVGDHPDFAKELAARFGARCLLVDPTRKHSQILSAWCDRDSRFQYLWAALGPRSGRMPFFESRRDISGSMFPTHRNIAAGDVDTYEVPVVTLDDLLQQVGGHIDVLKLDVEGAEFEVLERATPDALARIDQILVEFHDGTIPEFSRSDRDRAMRPLMAGGFKAVEYNGRDVLFFKPAQKRGRVA